MADCEVCGIELDPCLACSGTGERAEPNANLSAMQLVRCTICHGSGDREHDHSGDVAVMRDGWRGQFLAPTFVLDVHDLTSKVPSRMRDIAERYLAQMGMVTLGEETTVEEYEELSDYVTYSADSLLADAGYLAHWEDGYVIYSTFGPSFDAYREGS
jgi:hypothetical protein